MQTLKRHLRFEKTEDTEMSYDVLRRVTTLEVDLRLSAWKTTQRILSQVNPKVAQANLSQLLDTSLVTSLEENGFLPAMRQKIGN